MSSNRRTMIMSGILVILLVLILLALSQKYTDRTTPISVTSIKLNTVIKITIYDSSDTQLLQNSLDLCDKYENILSRTKESSELYQLNHGMLPKTGNSFHLSEECADVISKGLEYSHLSDGAFDITIGPVSSLWDFQSADKQVPSDSEIQSALPKVDYTSISLEGQDFRFLKDGMALDLGAISKGYIADKIKEYLISEVVTSAIIDLGGNVLCIGSHPDGTPFEAGIQKPFAERNETILTIPVEDCSLVTSGVYERYFEQNGKLYHHLLNPSTGYPYDNGLLSVTILSDKSVDGDGLSTACFALGLEKGLALINSLPDTEAVFITDDYQLHYSENFPRD